MICSHLKKWLLKVSGVDSIEFSLRSAYDPHCWHLHFLRRWVWFVELSQYRKGKSVNIPRGKSVVEDENKFHRPSQHIVVPGVRKCVTQEFWWRLRSCRFFPSRKSLILIYCVRISTLDIGVIMLELEDVVSQVDDWGRTREREVYRICDSPVKKGVNTWDKFRDRHTEYCFSPGV